MAYKYDRGGGGGRESDGSDGEMTTYRGEEEEDKAFSSEGEYGELSVYMYMYRHMHVHVHVLGLAY